MMMMTHHAYAYTYTYIRIHTYPYTYTHVPIHIYTHIHKATYANIYTHIDTLGVVSSTYSFIQLFLICVKEEITYYLFMY